MDARELSSKMVYLNMERSARKILLEDKAVSPEELAMMIELDVCNKLLESYDVVSCEHEYITIVKKKDMKTYNSIVKFLSR